MYLFTFFTFLSMNITKFWKDETELFWTCFSFCFDLPLVFFRYICYYQRTNMLMSFRWQPSNAFPSMLTRQKEKAFNVETQFVFSHKTVFRTISIRTDWIQPNITFCNPYYILKTKNALIRNNSRSNKCKRHK
jgi:hypothetical protein